MTETMFWPFGLVDVQFTNKEEAYMTYTAASHQGAMKIIWLHNWELLCHVYLYIQYI